MDRTETRIVNEILLAEDFSLYADGMPTSRNRSERNLRTIAHRYMVFKSPITLSALSLYEESVFQTSGFLIEITSGATRTGDNLVRSGSMNVARVETI